MAIKWLLLLLFISLWPPYVIGQAIIFLPCGFYLLLSFFFFFLAWSHQPHIGCLPYFGNWCGLSANLDCRSEMCCTRLAGNIGCKIKQKSPSGHHRTNLSSWIFATKACIDNRKKLFSRNISSTCPHNMANFGPLTAEIGSVVCGTPAIFNGFRVFAALLHATLVVGVSQTLRLWTEGTTYIRQGGHHVGYWPTF